MLQREQKLVVPELPGTWEGGGTGVSPRPLVSALAAQRLPRELFKTQLLGSTPRRFQTNEHGVGLAHLWF